MEGGDGEEAALYGLLKSMKYKWRKDFYALLFFRLFFCLGEAVAGKCSFLGTFPVTCVARLFVYYFRFFFERDKFSYFARKCDFFFVFTEFQDGYWRKK
jgi:hypothetical protein